MRIRNLTQPFNTLERRAVSGLAGIYGLRMLGLFLILPVFSLYARDLPGHTAFLIGVALGVYGLTQAVFQIPLGMLSDRIGRKPVIAGGLLVFLIGSAVAALATDIHGIILGRALQGAGAVAAAVMALAADLTRDEQRTKAMAIIGITIGAAFVLSLVLGPVLNELMGIPGIFWLTSVLAFLGIVVLYRWVPTPVVQRRHADTGTVPGQMGRVLRDPQLLRLDLGIFVLHNALTAMFVVVPVVLVDQAGLPSAEHWKIYLPVMLASALCMVPLIVLAERKGRMRGVFVGAVLALVLAELLLAQGHSSLMLLISGLFIFFTGFNFLEAALPSLVSRMAPAGSKGTAIGVYATFEFTGVFTGGALGGWLHGAYGPGGVFAFAAGLMGLWFLLALGMRVPAKLMTRTLKVSARGPEEAAAIARRLGAIAGVSEAVVVPDQGLAYLKVDGNALDEGALDEYEQAV